MKNHRPKQETIYPIHTAAELGDVKLVRLLLAAGADSQQRRDLFGGSKGDRFTSRSVIKARSQGLIDIWYMIWFIYTKRCSLDIFQTVINCFSMIYIYILHTKFTKHFPEQKKRTKKKPNPWLRTKKSTSQVVVHPQIPGGPQKDIYPSTSPWREKPCWHWQWSMWYFFRVSFKKCTR